MKRFQNILLVDPGEEGREEAVWRACELAKRNGGRLTVVGLAEELPENLPRGLEPSRDALRRRFREEHIRSIQEEVEEADRKNLDLKVEILEGTPYVKILEQVRRSKHDLVMLAAQGRKDLWFGSTITHVMRKAPCTVWAMKPRPLKSYERILAAVDVEEPGSREEGMNRGILEMASSLARMDEAGLEVVHAWSLAGEASLRRPGGLTPEEIERLVEETKTARSTWLDLLLDQPALQGVKLKRHLVRGDPGDAIPQIVRARKIDLIVMGTIGRTGLAGFFIGNTAEEVLQQVQCAVLSVKPGT